MNGFTCTVLPEKGKVSEITNYHNKNLDKTAKGIKK